MNGWGWSDGIVLYLAIVELMSVCRPRIQSDGCGWPSKCLDERMGVYNTSRL